MARRRQRTYSCMSRSNFASAWVLALLAGGAALACKSGEEGSSKVGPICPGCVAGGESSDFNGGSYPAAEDLCDSYYVVSERLETAGTPDDTQLMNDVRRRLSAEERASFSWSPNEAVESGAPATGYDPGEISVRTTFEWGETFVERLDPTRCASGYCFEHSAGQLVRCGWREERWLRQELEMHIATSDDALDVTLAGSARITTDGWVDTARMSGGEPRANASDATGTLRIAPSNPGDPRIGSSLVLNGAQVSGSVQISHSPFLDTGPTFPTYSPISGQWQAPEAATESECGWGAVPVAIDVAHDLLGGKTPSDLLDAVTAATAQPQSSSWETDGSELITVTFDDNSGSVACVHRTSLWFPEQRVRVTSSETDIDVIWNGLGITHEAGKIVGFSSDAQFVYKNERIGERIESLSELTGDKTRVEVQVSAARTNVDSGYGTWIETAFPGWDVSVVRYRPAPCPGDRCGYEDTLACLGTDELGYNACHATPENLPTKVVDLTEVVRRILDAQVSQQVTPGLPTPGVPSQIGVNPASPVTPGVSTFVPPGVSSVLPTPPDSADAGAEPTHSVGSLPKEEDAGKSGPDASIRR